MEEKQGTATTATRLQTLTQKRLDSLNDELSYDNVVECFPELRSSAQFQKSLRKIIQKLHPKVQKGLESIANDVYQDSDITNLIQQLDSLIERAEVRKKSATGAEKPVNISQLSPEHIVDSHLIEQKKAHIAKLQARLDSFSTLNVSLSEELDQLESQLSAECSKLDDSLTHVNQILQTTSSLPTRAQLRTKLS